MDIAFVALLRGSTVGITNALTDHYLWLCLAGGLLVEEVGSKVVV